ncbi:hypothetical protein AAY473_019476 [Plecturocebus cupreus]
MGLTPSGPRLGLLLSRQELGWVRGSGKGLDLRGFCLQGKTLPWAGESPLPYLWRTEWGKWGPAAWRAQFSSSSPSSSSRSREMASTAGGPGGTRMGDPRLVAPGCKGPDRSSKRQAQHPANADNQLSFILLFFFFFFEIEF